VAREHYGRLLRLRERGLPVTLEASVKSRFADKAPAAVNVIGEIRGRDPRLKDEVVMLGAHLDSLHGGTGALDDGAGSAVMMEALRLLRALGARPRRTVRIALWTGEEQGLLGSIAYVERHFGSLKTLELRPEHAKLSAYFNLDWGGGRIRGIYLQGNEEARPIFAELLQPLHDLGATTLTTLSAGGTDNMPFDALALPGFQFIQDALRYETDVAHTSLDVLEASSEDDLKQMAVVVASLAYHVAERDERLPRKPLVKPPLASPPAPQDEP
jgi:Zn-dependent M28 family amino/carboxypeptidase